MKATLFDHIKNVFSCLMLAGVWIYLLVQWSSLPEKLPGHYNFAGEIDRWGSRGELLIVPVVMLVLFILLSVLERFPHVWNTGVEVTKQNRERVYTLTLHLLTSSKLLMVAVFSYLTLCSAAARPLSRWFMPITIAALLGLLALYIVRITRIK